MSDYRKFPNQKEEKNPQMTESENFKDKYLESIKIIEKLENEKKILASQNNNLNNENQHLKNQINNSNRNLTFTEALNQTLSSNILGFNGPDLGNILANERENNPGFCNDRYFSWICCFSKDTIITVKENNEIIKKSIPEIKKDDLILTLINGEKKFTKVKFFQAYDDEYKFYEFKCMSKDKIKMITVTHNHIMMVYDKDMKELKYKTAENVIKNEDYFNTIDGLYEVKEIRVFNMKYKYALGVDEGSIVADDILVSCLNMNDFSKNLSLNELIKKYNIKIM